MKKASEIDADNKPVTLTDSFNVDSPIIYLTGTLNNAPDDTLMKAEWVYVENDPL